ncbi:hypothetical protein E8E13_007813 [Curvularia kusanoi]|uniref:GED domain-containing protein n=1 Tax=Curvularia kusanoi TaxID=90978 RepID=A0A9P4TAR0_CURKU|nr:hypothetical protein E8E13_007813 [Curvularia kusanoi]
MAGATRNRPVAGAPRTRGRAAIKTPSSSSEGTIPPEADTISDNDNPIDPDTAHPISGDQGDHDEVAPLGASVIEALAIISKLEKLQLDKQQISLPKCVVLGQQSTGKSSVIEAISGIKTPRDTGTCTRAPLFIELKPAGPGAAWHASISLMLQYDFAPAHNVPAEIPGWKPAATPRTEFFVETDDPDQLEYLIRCAQRAVLSPFEDPASFLDPAFDNSNGHKALFSPNIVCIAVSKSGLPPLSFFDLPGMIGQSETPDEQYTVLLTEKLVTKYIEDPEAMILVTCALENDVANSIAAGLARKLEVTDRCLGILTKPDRLPPLSSSAELAGILDGHKFAMGHGYFVVKNLSSDQIQQGFTHLDARRMEEEFFSSVAPWSTDLQHCQTRFGTLRLQQYLSSQLGNRVLSKLPFIQRQIEDRLAAVEVELSQIPDVPLHTAVRTVADVVQDFAVTVRNEISGEHGFISWSNTWDRVQQTMWEDLDNLKPTMMILGKLDEGLFAETMPGRSADDAISIDSDDDTAMSGGPETPSKKRKHNVEPKSEQTPAPGVSPFRTPRKPIRPGRGSQSTGTASSSGQSNEIPKREPFTLDGVNDYVKHNSRAKVPGHMNPKVREELMLSAFEHWPKVIDNFFTMLNRELKESIKAIFHKDFSRHAGSKLFTESFAIVQSLLDNNIHEQRATMAIESLKDEQEGPHIFHKAQFRSEKQATMERYAQARHEARFKALFKQRAAHIDRELTPQEKEKMRKDEKIKSLIAKEPYSHEIDLIADITTYYMIAARRLHDAITMRIESKFFKQLRVGLRDQLQDELGIYDGPQGQYKAQLLLTESPERMTRRNVLVTRRNALVEGLQCFSEHVQRFQANHDVDAGPSHYRRPSNYQQPSVASHDSDYMEDVRQHNLPVRSMSRTV